MIVVYTAMIALVVTATSCAPKENRRCVRSHVETRHQDSQMLMMPTHDGKSMAPMFFPEYDYTVTVCDEWMYPEQSKL